MCLMCDGWTAGQVQQHLNLTIERYGWAFQYVEDPNPKRCFGYTIGLTKRGEPEFLVRGLDMEDTSRMFGNFAASVAGGRDRFGHGHTAHWVDGRLLYFSTMHGASKFALGAYARYGWETRVLEIHFMDREVPPPSPALVFKGISTPVTRGPVARR